MSLKKEIQTWGEALAALDKRDYDSALRLFDSIAESSRVFFNIGILHATLGEHEQAVLYFSEACQLDSYLAVANFQSGVSLFLLGRYQEAEREFSLALDNMRGNQFIDYEQIGLAFKLYSCEILFNKALSLLNSDRRAEGLSVLDQARKEKQAPQHAVIEEAYFVQGGNYTVFSIPVGVVYRPPASKLNNLKPKDYLGSAKLVAAIDARDAFTGFSGIVKANRTAGARAQKLSVDSTLDRVLADNVDLDLSRAKKRRPSAPDSAVQSPTSQSPISPLSRSGTLDDPRRSPIAAFSPTLRSPATSFPPLQPTIVSLAQSRSAEQSTVSKPTSTQYVDNTNYLDTFFEDYQDPAAKANATRRQLVAESVLFETPAIIPLQTRKAQIEERKSVISNQSGTNKGTRNGNPKDLRTLEGQNPLRVAQWAADQQSLASPASDYMFPSPVDRTPDVPGSTRSMSLVPPELARIRVKLYFGTSVRGMSIRPDVPHQDFVVMVCTKFKKNSLTIQFKDEDGTMIDIEDESDFESAIHAAREMANGKLESKLDIYVTER